MNTTRLIEEVRDEVEAARARGLRVGCVPTMGALHEGHLSLIRRARQECDYVLTTIFVNPTQFGPSEDLSKYPRPLETDLSLCREEQVDLVFHPDESTMYPPGESTVVDVGGLDSIWEGAHRPGHFRGVSTVVAKLFNIVWAHDAYFGQKDYQQQLLIRRMCKDLCLPVRIQTCPIVRDPDGLALSSRNVYLSDEERQSALALSQSLKLAREQLAAGKEPSAVRAAMLEHLNGTSNVAEQYATVADAETLEELDHVRSEMVALVAAKVGSTRLIDNELISLE
ncbi:MAG: pantoate--beta-alanine ligase [Planctomycetaceae bacterium]|nr:pantoate--beta-alanine ligase [Planctomycetaceae bacterium]